MCPLSDRKRQKFVLVDIEHPYMCKIAKLVKLQKKKLIFTKQSIYRTILCDGCDLFLNEDINKRWISGIDIYFFIKPSIFIFLYRTTYYCC
jgi:hypothetical protein